MTHDDDEMLDDDRLDRLVDRAVDRSASLDDWDALDAEAQADPTVWSWLGRAVRDDGLLRAVMAARVEVADRVELPGDVEVAEPAAPRPWWRAARPALGWAAAVAFAVLWWVDRGPVVAAPTLESAPGLVEARPAPASDVPLAVPASANDDEVLGELPMLLVSTTPLDDDGRTEVVYVRRTLERAVVDSVLEVGLDERGLPEPVPAAAPVAFTESF